MANSTGLSDRLDREESDRDLVKRAIEALIEHISRIEAVAGKPIRIDLPLVDQFDPETLDALAQVMFDDEELDDLFAAMDREV
jgi:hypothetical protein